MNVDYDKVNANQNSDFLLAGREKTPERFDKRGFASARRARKTNANGW
jgi:hypothetical protein